MRGKKEAWTGDQNGPLIFVNLSIKKYVRKFQIWVFIESYKHFKFQNSEIQYQFPIRKQPKKSIVGIISAKSNRSLLTYWYGKKLISDKKYGKYLMSEK